MADERELVSQFTAAADRFSASSARLARALEASPTASGSSNVNVNLGGGGLVMIICAVSALACVISTITAGVWLIQQSQQLARQHTEITDMRADLRGQRAWVQRLTEERDHGN